MKRDIEKVEIKDNKYSLILDDESVLIFDKNEENKNNIEFLLDEQLENRIKKLKRFITSEKKHTFFDGALSFTGLCALTFGCISGLVAGTELLYDSSKDSTGALVASGALIGTYAAIKVPYLCKSYKFNKNKKLVYEELDKLNYLDNNIELLRSFEKYDNSLVGLDEFKQQYIKDTDFPFTIVDGEELTLEDYIIVVDNINYGKSIKEEINKTLKK